MNKVDLLNNNYKAFIDLENPKDFFIGLCDYMDFVSKTSPFDIVIKDLIKINNIQIFTINKLGELTVEALDNTKKEIETLLLKEKIDNDKIKKLIEGGFGYNAFKNGDASGGYLPESLYDILSDIIKIIYKEYPEQREKVLKYVEFDKYRKDSINYYLKSEELDKFRESLEEYNEKKKVELWGQISGFSKTYTEVKGGIKEYKKMIEESKSEDREIKNKATSELFLNKVFYRGAWQKMLNEENNFDFLPEEFNMKIIKPICRRLNNYLISSCVEAENAIKEKNTNKSNIKMNQEYKLPKGAKWCKLKIKFFDGHTVKVSYDGIDTKTFDYKDMGFLNHKTNNPDRKWEFLKKLSEQDGRLTNDKWDRKFSKNIKYELNNTLKEFFNMKENPILNYTKRDGYKTEFILEKEG